MSDRSTVVQSSNVRIFDIIAHIDNVSTLCGDISNEFVTDPVENALLLLVNNPVSKKTLL